MDSLLRSPDRQTEEVVIKSSSMKFKSTIIARSYLLKIRQHNVSAVFILGLDMYNYVATCKLIIVVHKKVCSRG